MVEIVPCVFDLAKDRYCRNDGYHITSPMTRGKQGRLTFTVRNTGTAVTGPLSAFVLGCDSTFGGCHHESFYLPDRFTLLGCSPACKGAVVADRTMWELSWAGKIPPGSTVDLVISFRADHSAYNYVESSLFAESMASHNLHPLSKAKTIGEWSEVQIVVTEP